MIILTLACTANDSLSVHLFSDSYHCSGGSWRYTYAQSVIKSNGRGIFLFCCILLIYFSFIILEKLTICILDVDWCSVSLCCENFARFLICLAAFRSFCTIREPVGGKLWLKFTVYKSTILCKDFLTQYIGKSLVFGHTIHMTTKISAWENTFKMVLRSS